VSVIVEKPRLSFARTLNRPLLGLTRFMKAEKSILEHGVHQCGLGADDSKFAPRIKKPFRKHHGGARPFITWGSARRHRLACLVSISGAMTGAHLDLLFTSRSVATRGYSCALAEELILEQDGKLLPS
jgi:hypothetical protein